MHRLCIALVKSKLEYASVLWNSITSADGNKLERIQQRFAALCFNRFFLQVHYSYSLAKIAHFPHEEASPQVYLGSKFGPSVLETVGFRDPAR
jgi:hypothetical protein